MNLLCYTLGLENNPLFGYTAEKFFDKLSELNISHSMFYTKNKKKIILKIFADEDKVDELSEIISEYIIENYYKKTALLFIDRNYHFFDEKEKADHLASISGKYTLQRSKGLGENEPEMMWQTTMNPETRRLIKVMPEGMIETKETFELLLGDNLQGRKDYISENGYLYLEEADIS